MEGTASSEEAEIGGGEQFPAAAGGEEGGPIRRLPGVPASEG